MVGYARRNFLVPVPRVESFEALNAHLEQRCLERMDARYGDTLDHGQRMERDPARCCLCPPCPMMPMRQTAQPGQFIGPWYATAPTTTRRRLAYVDTGPGGWSAAATWTRW